MKKKALLILPFFVLVSLAFFLKPEEPAASGKLEVDYPHETGNAWEYPIQPGTEEWIALESTEKRREACQVPQEALEEMDTEALLETALDYPFCTDMWAFDRLEDGYRHQLMHNSALEALESRDDRHEVVQARLADVEAWLNEVGMARSAESGSQYSYLRIFAEYMG